MAKQFLDQKWSETWNTRFLLEKGQKAQADAFGLPKYSSPTGKWGHEIQQQCKNFSQISVFNEKCKTKKTWKTKCIYIYTVCPIQDYWQHILILSAAGKFYLPGYPLRLPHSSTSKFDGVVIFCLNLGTLSSVCIFSLPWYMSVQVELILS